MSPARLLKDAFKSVLHHAGYELYKRPFLPKGADVFESIRAHWPQWTPTAIFDIGANVGQTVGRLRPLFAGARIHAFEPVPATFEALCTACARDALVSPHRLALSSAAGETEIHLHRFSEQSSLVSATAETAGASGATLRVTLDTADAVAVRLGLDRVNLIKIDVEGHEMSVLAGAVGLLGRGAVDFLVIEAGLIPGNPRFTPLPDLIEFLRAHDYWLIGVYEQFGLRFPQSAEFCNALFAHRSHLEESRPITSSEAPPSFPAA